MARTDAGALLTAQHRRAQVALRAAALRDFVKLWPLWDGTSRTFQSLVVATLPLIRVHHQLSGTLAATYYQALRAAEQAAGNAVARPAPLDTSAAAGTLYVTGLEMTRRALQAGQSPQAALQTALTRTSGTVGRFVLAGGRDTLVSAVRDDAHADGYRRVLSPGACDYCQSLAVGAVTDDFSAHDHCGCSAEPSFI
jgi:hypothetical protein